MDNTPFPNHCREDLFVSGHFFSGIADDAYADLRILTVATKIALTVVIDAAGVALAQWFKGVTYSASGTSVLVYNNNENSDRQASFTVFHTPTIDVAGNVNSPQIMIFGSERNRALSSLGRANVSRLLEPNTEYLVRVQNVSGGAINIGITLEVVEV